MTVSHRNSHTFLSAFNSGIYSLASETMVISQRSQIMSLSVDYHYKNKYELCFLILWECRDLLELQRSVKMLKGCNLCVFPISSAT